MTAIISLGGSMIAPDQVDHDFLKAFRALTLDWLNASSNRRLILITGGGAPARKYQEAYRAVVKDPSSDTQDWIGIAATHLNAALVRAIYGEECPTPVITDPTAAFDFKGRILVAAGWKPGFSTDYDAVMLAERFEGEVVVNLSNIAQVYTDDPKTNPSAQPLTSVTWTEFQKIVGTEWTPGKNTPFDPVATQKAAQLGLRVYVAAGKDLPNLRKILDDEPFFGTVIHP